MRQQYAAPMEAEAECLFAGMTLSLGGSWGAIQSDATLRPGMGAREPVLITHSTINYQTWVFCAVGNAFGARNYLASKNG